MRHVLTSLFVLLTTFGYAADYYIAFDTGSDANNGTATGTPWQHCPGDANATTNALAHTTVAGDNFYFKGGVVYYGSITVPASGTEGSRITYKGNTAGWGTGKAILDGSVAWSPAWNDEGGNVYSATPPGGATWLTPIYRNGELLYWSQEPDMDDPFFYDWHSDFWTVAESSCTLTSIDDAANLTNASASYFDYSYVIANRSPNVTDIRAITGFDPADDEITFSALGGILYDPVEYSILNEPTPDVDGEIYFGATDIFLYSTASPAGDTFRYGGSNTAGISLGTGDNYITVDGIAFQNFWGAGQKEGNGVIAYGPSITGLIVQDCEVSNCVNRNTVSAAGGGIHLNNDVSNSTVTGCTVTNQWGCSGIQAINLCSGITVTDCVVNRVGYVGIYFLKITGVNEISSCTVRTCNATHANNFSVFGDSTATDEEVLVAHCRSLDGKTNALNAELLTTLTLFCNVFHSGWAHTTGYKMYTRVQHKSATDHLVIINNVGLENSAWAAVLQLNSYSVLDGLVMLNNIFQGGGWREVSSADFYHDYNIFSNSRAWYQAVGEMNSNESVELEEDLFSAVTSETLTIPVSSPLIDAGTNPAAYLPTDAFPNYDFTVDIVGNTLGAVGYGYDLGPWEYQSAVSPPTKANTPGPADSATGISVTTDLSWVDGGGATTFNVYFPTLVSSGQVPETYDPGTLAYSTEYTWRIDSVSDGGTTTGDTWTFTTEAAPVLVRRIGFVGSGGQIHVITVDQP